MHCFTTSNSITAPAVVFLVLKTGYGNVRGNVSVELQTLHKCDRLLLRPQHKRAAPT
ncbi:MAG: hypothetical protein RMX65_013090 [Nostoc sp. DedQUE01]